MRLMSVMALAIVLVDGASTGHAEEQPHVSPPIDIVRVVGHTGAVTALAFSPDGKTLATGSDDYTVKLWNAATGLMLRTIDGHPYGILAVAFSANGKDALSVSQLDKITVNVSDATTGQLKRTLDNKEALSASRLIYGAGSLAFSPDGSMLALAVSSSSLGRMIEIIDTNTGAMVRQIRAAERTYLAFSPDGRQLAAANEDQSVTLWDTASGKEVRRLGGGSWLDIFKKQSKDRIEVIAFSTDGRKLAAGAGRTLMQFDVTGGKLLSTVESGDTIDALAFSPDGSMLATASSENIDIRDAATGSSRHKLENHAGYGKVVVAFSPDGRMLASGGPDKLVRLWDATNWSHARKIEGINYTIGAVAVTSDGATIASDSFGGFTVLWDAAKGQFLRPVEGNREVSSGTYQYAYTVGMSPDGWLLTSGSRPTTALVWEVATGNTVLSLKHAGDDGVGVRSVAFLPAGKALLIGGATAGREPNTRELPPALWDLSANKLLRTLDGEPHTYGTFQFVYPIAVSPDGRLVATGSRDRVINLFDVASGRRVSSVQTSEIATYALAFSADGKILASSSLGVPTDTIELWDVATATLLRKIDARAKHIRSLVFSPDNGILASGSEDKIIKLWNPTDGVQFGALRGHDGWITALAFAAKGNILVSGSSDGALKIWRTGSFDLLATLVAEPSGEWIAFTPEGYFDGSGRSNKLAIVRGLEAYSIDSFYEALHRPDLVAEKLKGDPQGKVKAAAMKLDLTKLIGQ
jgi:WD40 repeat protein